MTVIFGALLSMAVVFFYNFFTAEKISYNIKLLLKSLENMHKDRFDSTPQSTTPDEFGEISRSVYHLGLKMQKSAEELQQERFFRVEAESERGEKEARLRQLNAQIDRLVLATKQMRVSIPDENPYGCRSLATTRE
jgi:sensor histidine kinase YesM